MAMAIAMAMAVGNGKSMAQRSPFTISDKLKAALCTEGQMSPDQFDRICENCEDF